MFASGLNSAARKGASTSEHSLSSHVGRASASERLARYSLMRMMRAMDTLLTMQLPGINFSASAFTICTVFSTPDFPHQSSVLTYGFLPHLQFELVSSRSLSRPG